MRKQDLFMKNRKKMTAVLISIVLGAALLSGCGQTKSVEEQVTEELLGKDKSEPAKAPVKEKIPAPDQSGDKTIKIDDKEIVIKDYGSAVADGSDNVESSLADDAELQIVFLGDSILDNYRDDTGIAYLTGDACNAAVYNLAMGGTTAALDTYARSGYDEWDTRNFTGVVNAICGDVDPSFMDGYRAREVFDMADFSKTDYFVIEYGVNDFMAGIPIMRDNTQPFDQYSYAGAVRYGVEKLKTTFPDAMVIFVTPVYTQFWNGSVWVGDVNTVNNGYGTLFDYICAGYNAAIDAGGYCIDGYSCMGIDTYTASDDLEDGIHLSVYGRQKYAAYLSHIINKEEGREDTEWSWDNWNGWGEYISWVRSFL